jgi:hypothetical protein
MKQPNILYKYMPSSYEKEPKTEDGYIKCLDNGMVKYSSISDLNDPHEFMPFTFSSNYHEGLKNDREKELSAITNRKCSRAEKKKWKQLIYIKYRDLLNAINDKDPEMDSKIYRDLQERRKKNWGLFCLSETWQSLVMWHFYADSQSGVCIGWDANCSIFQKSATELPGNDYGFLSLGKVEYVETTEKAKVDVFTGTHDRRTFFIKYHEWSYEREWRSIVRWDAFKQEAEAKSNPKAGLIHLGVELIKEIIVGSKCPPIVKHKAAKFGLLQGIPVYSMILGNDHFGARRELIGDFER